MINWWRFLSFLGQNLGRLISLPSTFYSIAGKVQRIAELHEVIDELQLAAPPTPTPATAAADVEASTTGDAAADSDGGSESTSTAEAAVGPCISFEGVDIVSPGGDAFAKGVSFTVPQGAGVCLQHLSSCCVSDEHFVAKINRLPRQGPDKT